MSDNTTRPGEVVNLKAAIHALKYEQMMRFAKLFGDEFRRNGDREFKETPALADHIVTQALLSASRAFYDNWIGGDG